MLFTILTQIVLPVAVLALLAWAWSKRKPDVPIGVPRSDVPYSDVGRLSPEEAARIKRMLDQELLPRGFTMRIDGTQEQSYAAPTYTRTFQYSKGALILNVERRSDWDGVGDAFVCDAATDQSTRRVTGFSEYAPRRILTEDQLAEFQRDIGAFLDAEGT